MQSDFTSVNPGALAVVETHPVQYHAPVYRALQEKYGIPVTAIYGSDFSVSGYRDAEFQAEFAWDTDLLLGYGSTFLSKVSSPVNNNCGSTLDTMPSRGIARALRAARPQAILLVGYGPRLYKFAWLEAMRTRCPLLFRAETTDHAQTRSTIKREVRDGLLRCLYRSCSKLLFIGERSREHYAVHGCREEKLVFSPYCVDVAPFQVTEECRARLRAETRASLGIHGNETVVLFSGKLSHRKGPDLLIAAVKLLPPEDMPKTVVLFLGSGEMESDLRSAANSDPRIRACFVGFQNQKQLSPWYHAADLLALPSRHSETWGLVVNEALHHGLPCVVSDQVGCWPDLIVSRQTGEVFQTGSAEALAGALVRAGELTNRPLVRELCRAKVGGYTIERAAAGIADAYRSAISN